MSDMHLSQFENQSYLNLETFRKSGVGVQTPVWFVEDSGVLYVRTIRNSGKVKRIRNNSQVRIVPSGGRGEPRGEWVDARAALADEACAELVNKLMKRKYGMQKSMFDMLGRFNKSDYATLAIHIPES
jgi:PPOX class probable F420-dependent enzyme